MIALCCVPFVTSGCGPGVAVLAQRVVVKAFEEALAQLLAQQLVALVAHNEASIARVGAQLKVDFAFQSPQTQSFIGKWRDAEREIVRLRKSFTKAQAASDALMEFLGGKATTIRDAALRQRSEGLIAKKKERYTASLARAGHAIAALEASIVTGNDIVTALEIAGALGGFDEKLVSLQQQNDEIVAKLPDMGAMIDEGMALVDLEFGALGG